MLYTIHTANPTYSSMLMAPTASQASPYILSLESVWALLEMSLQLSQASPTPSPSASPLSGLALATSGQLSEPSATPKEIG